MSAVDLHLLPKSAVVEKEGAKEELKERFPGEPANEEKKDTEELPSDDTGPFIASICKGDLETGGSAQPLGPGSRFQRIPEDLADMIGDRYFSSEEDLEVFLVAQKISDERIVLGDDGKAYLYMPGEEHNAATGYIARRFNVWAREWKGCAGENTNVKLGPRIAGAPPPRKRQKRKKRLPDVAFWGRSKCELRDNGEILKEMRVSPASAQPVVHPHVVVQVSVFNDEDYEVDAINDLTTRAVAGQGVQPNLGVLIKQRAGAVGVQARFDIYYLPTGTFMRDALNGTNGARHVVYNHGGPDVLVTITEQDLGGIQLPLWQTIREFLHGGTKDFELSMAQEIASQDSGVLVTGF